MFQDTQSFIALTLVLTFVSMYIAWVCLRNYAITKYEDYIYLSLVALSASANQVLNVLVLVFVEYKILLNIGINISYVLFLMWIFVYITKMRWFRPPAFIYSLGLFWALLIIFQTLLWSELPLSDVEPVLFLELRRVPLTDLSNVGLASHNGIVISARGFKLLETTYRCFVGLYTFTVVAQTGPMKKTPHTTKVKALWLFSSSTLVIWGFFYLSCSFSILPWIQLLSDVFLITGMVAIAWIVLRYPETVLYSRVQYQRVMSHLMDAQKVPKKVDDRRMRESVLFRQFLDLDRHIQNQLTSMRGELEQKTQELNSAQRAIAMNRELVSFFAHDLKNSLSLILNSSKILSQFYGPSDGDDKKKILAIVNKSLVHMEALVEELFLTSLLEYGEYKLDYQRTNLVELTKVVVEQFKIDCIGKNIEITVDGDEDLPLVLVDSTQIERVIRNLLSNAVKYTKPSSKVDVRVGMVHRGLEWSVTDEGPGITPEDIPKLFKPFSRIANSEKWANTGGTGLGLVLVKKIVEGHGGEVNLRCDQGKGATFVFTLPVEE